MTDSENLEAGNIVLIKGSGKNPYELKKVHGVYSCSCPAWRNAGGSIDNRTCKHLKKVRGIELEETRLNTTLAPIPVAEVEAPPLLLAHTWVDQDPAGWWISEKYDGLRAYWTGTKFVSRLGNDFHPPAWFTAGLPDTPLDGELWMGRKKFQQTSSIVRSLDAGDEWKKLRFFIFDAPSDEPFEQRIAKLKTIKQPYSYVVEHIKCDGVKHLQAALKAVQKLGGEGLMLREPGSAYESGRSNTLLKVKDFKDGDARVIGYEDGKGKHLGRVGSLLVTSAEGTVFSVGSGLTDAQRENPPAIDSIIHYKYQELSDGGVPRFPTFTGVAVDRTQPTRLVP